MKVDISTAVDSLVNLVNEKQSIPLEDAAEELGVPENILNEWAVFLEEEHILKIDYKVTKPILVAVEHSPEKETEREDLASEKENLKRRANYILSGLEKYHLQPSVEIKTEEDIRTKILTHGSPEDLAYARKFILTRKIQRVLQQVVQATTIKELASLQQILEKIEQQRSVFEQIMQNLQH